LEKILKKTQDTRQKNSGWLRKFLNWINKGAMASDKAAGSCLT
jgi:hypothetical protein